ncbi:unnamed protein product, partial [Mesorhabditis spiculigera]
MVSAYSAIILAAIGISLASACTDTNTNCANWSKNGFCTSSFYTPAQKSQYCPSTCNLCGSVTGSTCSDSNAK